MTFRENLVNARSHIIFIVALLLGLAMVIFLDSKIKNLERGNLLVDLGDKAPSFSTTGPIGAFNYVEPLPLAKPAPLDAKYLAYAKTAWIYFENNTDAKTGLVNSTDGYPSTTMWETGSYIMAVTSADLLGLIDQKEAQMRLDKMLTSLTSQRLFDDILPNKAYNAKTNELVDYANKPSKRGLGWSALDISRIMSGLVLIERQYPELSPKVEKLISRWDLNKMVSAGMLLGGNLDKDKLRFDQEGRVGYEQYAAKAMMLRGFDMFAAYDVTRHLMVKYVEDQPIAVDDRLHRNVAPAFAVSEPYLFDGLEFGYDTGSHHIATAMYKAQEARFQRQSILTAVSETHLNVEPYFIYSSVWGGGEPWAVLSFKGERLDSKRTVAIKVAFAWDALFQTEYTKMLVEKLAPLGDPKKGFPEGLFESDGKTNTTITTNTNAVILASLAYRAFGPLHHAHRRSEP